MEASGPSKIRTSPTGGLVRCVGFAPTADTSPSSVLRAQQHEGDSPASTRGEPVESPLAAALKRAQSERSLPALPKLKLGKPKGLPRSKSQGNLQRPAAVDVPPLAPQTRSATSSPSHAASSAGSEPVRIE